MHRKAVLIVVALLVASFVFVWNTHYTYLTYGGMPARIHMPTWTFEVYSEPARKWFKEDLPKRVIADLKAEADANPRLPDRP